MAGGGGGGGGVKIVYQRKQAAMSLSVDVWWSIYVMKVQFYMTRPKLVCPNTRFRAQFDLTEQKRNCTGEDNLLSSTNKIVNNLGIKFNRRHFEIFFIFIPENRF